MTETLETALRQELNEKLKRIAELKEALRHLAARADYWDDIDAYVVATTALADD